MGGQLGDKRMGTEGGLKSGLIPRRLCDPERHGTSASPQRTPQVPQLEHGSNGASLGGISGDFMRKHA